MRDPGQAQDSDPRTQATLAQGQTLSAIWRPGAIARLSLFFLSLQRIGSGQAIGTSDLFLCLDAPDRICFPGLLFSDPI
jgi:hypothetical protein